MSASSNGGGANGAGNALRVQSAMDACAAALRGLSANASDDISEQNYRIGQAVEIKINTTAEDAERHLHCDVSGETLGSACEQAELLRAETEGWIVRFAPAVEDTYTLCVKWDERHISGSPFRLAFRGASEPSKIIVRGIEEDTRWTVTHPVHFKVDTRAAGKGQLIVRASGPTQGIPKFDLHDNGDGTYKASYIPSAVGEHSFDITYADQPVPGKSTSLFFYQFKHRTFRHHGVVAPIYKRVLPVFVRTCNSSAAHIARQLGTGLKHRHARGTCAICYLCSKSLMLAFAVAACLVLVYQSVVNRTRHVGSQI